MEPVIRIATPEDAAAMVRLRAAMFAAMGRPPGPDDAPWRASAHAWFEAHLVPGSAALAVVAAVPADGVVACALAVLVPRAPDPADPSPWWAHVSQVSTLPGHRRRGRAGACLRLLLQLLDERGVRRADLSATVDGEGLYRRAGFVDPPHPALRRHRPEV